MVYIRPGKRLSVTIDKNYKMNKYFKSPFKTISKLPVQRLFLASMCFLIVGFALLPFLLAPKAGAAQITSRKLTMSSARPDAANATTTYTFNFTVPTTGTIVKSFEADACTTAVGTCTTPTGFLVSSSTLVTQPTNLGDASGWTISTATAGSLRITKTTNATTPTGAQTVVINNVQNPTTANTAFYMRLTTYSDAAWTTAIDTGTVAGTVTQTLTIGAQVAEILQFCVGSTAIDDATSAIGATCGAGTTVNIGTLDPTAVNVSPVSANGGTNTNGLAILRTNAVNGSAVFYDAIQDSGTTHPGALRIAGANCTTNPYSCINSIGTTQAKITAGTQNYGMTIAGTNCGTAATYYTCVYGSSSEHLVPSTNYVGQTGSYCVASACNTSGNGFAWVEGGTATQIASAASNNTVADEALILKFAATPSITTTFGVYTVKADFTAVPTY